MRSIFIMVLLVLAALCAFGFAATFEPLDRGPQLLWRAAYGVGGLASLAGVGWILARGLGGRESGGSDR